MSWILVCHRLKDCLPETVTLINRAYHWSFLIFTLYLLLENNIPVRQVLKGTFQILFLIYIIEPLPAA